MKTTSIQTRIPKDMKQKVQKILKRLGLDFSTAIRLYYAQIIETGGLPFPITTHSPRQKITLDQEIAGGEESAKKLEQEEERKFLEIGLQDISDEEDMLSEEELHYYLALK